MNGSQTKPLLRLLDMRSAALIMLFGHCASASAEMNQIKIHAAYAETARVREEVQEECRPEAMLSAMMREEILNRTPIRNVVLTDALSGNVPGLALDLSILEVRTPPATSWTSEMRSLKVRSVIYQDGSMAGEYVRNAKTPGGGSLFTKAFKNSNSCQVLERLAREVSVQTVERFKLMKLLPESVSAVR